MRYCHSLSLDTYGALFLQCLGGDLLISPRAATDCCFAPQQQLSPSVDMAFAVKRGSAVSFPFRFLDIREWATTLLASVWPLPRL